MCKTAETSRTQMKTIQGDIPSSGKSHIQVDTVSDMKDKKKRNSSDSFSKRPDPHKSKSYPYQAQGQGKRYQAGEVRPCGKCGTRHYPKPCPAMGKTCHICKRKHHFAKVCRSRRRRKIYMIGEDSSPSQSETEVTGSDSDNGLYIGELNVNSLEGRRGWFEEIIVNDQEPVNCKLDTGADVSVLPLKQYKKISKSFPEPMEKWSEPLWTYGQNNVKTCGRVIAKCSTKGAESSVIFYVVDTNAVPILGREDCETLKLITRKSRPEIASVSKSKGLLTKEEIFKTYPEVFKGLGLIEGKYHIETDPNVTPVIHPPRKFAYLIENKLNLDLLNTGGPVRLLLWQMMLQPIAMQWGPVYSAVVLMLKVRMTPFHTQ